METESRMELPGEGETGSYCLMDSEFLAEGMGKFWKWTAVMAVQQWESTQCLFKKAYNGSFYVIYIFPQ